jgi:DNA-binding CsgD family transcriptional regulator
VGAKPRLSARDFEALWTLVHELHGTLDPDAFVSLVLTRLPALISSEITTFDEMRPTGHESRHWVAPEAAVPLRLLPVWEHVMHEHPVLDYVLRTGDTSAHKVSDFSPPTAFLDSRFYNEWYRQIGVRHALNTSVEASLSVGVVVGVGLHRRARDFSERDLAVLNLLRPHLVQAYQNSLVVSGLASLVDHRHDGAVVLGRDGRILVATARARATLNTYFARDGHHGARLPEPLDRWVEAQLREFGSKDRLPAPRRPFVVDRPGTRLVVHLLESSAGPVLSLAEECHTIPRESVLEWQLTDREAEVLAWLIEGKTNAEIASILTVRTRTVDKHCERVYQKLGVENRTAAVRRALDSTPATFLPLRPTHATSPGVHRNR